MLILFHLEPDALASQLSLNDLHIECKLFTIISSVILYHRKNALDLLYSPKIYITPTLPFIFDKVYPSTMVVLLSGHSTIPLWEFLTGFN